MMSPSRVADRLSESPERYGKLLGCSMKGLRRLRIGDYRVAYQIEESRVTIWAILHRKEIYLEIGRRYAG